jgi:CrcB protein
MIRNVLLVALGGALGSVARFLITKWIQGSVMTAFPIGTMIVNVVGCLLIGFLYGIFERADMLDPALRLTLTVGFCGGFTTFSTFMNESVGLMRTDNILYSALYLGGSVVLGFFAVLAGSVISKAI